MSVPSAVDWQKQREQLLGAQPVLNLPWQFQLPIFPQAVNEFNRTASQSQTTLEQLAQILETENGLIAEVFAFVNSSLISVLCVKTVVLTAAVKQALTKSHSRWINHNLAWTANLERALFARELALLLRADPELAYATAMLQDLCSP